jgi:hypothetical protein
MTRMELGESYIIASASGRLRLTSWGIQGCFRRWIHGRDCRGQELGNKY